MAATTSAARRAHAGAALVALAVALALVALRPARAAAACSRACPVTERDEHGCCPAKPKSRPGEAALVLGARPPLCRDLAACAAACTPAAPATCARAGDLALFGLARQPIDVAAARAHYTTGCDAGAQRSCTGLAILLDQGVGGPIDNAAAATLYRKACTAGVGRACVGLVEQQLLRQTPTGRGEPLALIERATRLLSAACERNEDRACLEVLRLVSPRDGVRSDGDLHLRAFRRALASADAYCADGLEDACVVAASLRVDEVMNPTPTPNEGLGRLTVLCDAGVPAACGALVGYLQFHRTGSDLRIERAARQGCEVGWHGGACVVLASLIRALSPAQVEAYDARACDLGVGAGCAAVAAAARARGDAAAAEAAMARLCEVAPRSCVVSPMPPPSPKITLSSTCGVRWPTAWTVNTADGVVALSGTAVALDLTALSFDLPREPGRYVLVAEDYVTGRVRVNLIAQGTTYANHENADATMHVGGTIVVKRFEAITGRLELELHDVTLLGARAGQCVLNGTIKTFGRVF